VTGLSALRTFGGALIDAGGGLAALALLAGLVAGLTRRSAR
jgi:hypothetical protein